ncbi:FAD binding domain-containing protein [Jiangella mangrovi]|uniref:Xanthine dehydrogenase YagS FAD-binding subunit n=1 Tax=Jiangella mangrovi TaxID=1524084 RepID=A0A7W9GS92_9ACTN|nr:xanthine dehydrogenase family protein subunit M [Jiangella mangrovi]MBB5789105.1 xanthine dehydrogenase YagS FAD-binding subunit [Jiangella mangrovi]
MRDIGYARATSGDDAVRLAGEHPGARYLAGGTNLVDLWREGVEDPDFLVDVTRAGLDGIEATADGGLLVGAGVRNTDLARDHRVRTAYPALAQAVLAGASGQLRNLATVGGNLLQRTRCLYFYDTASACNKRTPGAGCDARDGFSRMGAILGASEHCVAVHPSDLCVALAAFDAVVHLLGPDGARRVPLTEFHLLPGDRPDLETVLRPGELVTAVELPPSPVARTSRYRKVRDRASYAFALVSVAAALDVDDGAVRAARVALGGVAARPWRATRLEAALTGAPATDESFAAAVDAELAGAHGTRDSAFKIDLVRRTVPAVLRRLRDEGGAA